ncbi:MAG: metallophosphoesterase [Oscillospiraceae bacterium]|nr:metallophosphoesterase [Oscillospiraceae bacterium]
MDPPRSITASEPFSAGDFTLTLTGGSEKDVIFLENGCEVESLYTYKNGIFTLSDLPEGRYRAEIDGESVPFAVSSADFDISALTYTEGEAIHLRCTEDTEDAWVAVYRKGDDYTSEALLWDWCADLDGPTVDLGELKRSNAALPLGAGDYEAVLFSEGHTVQEMIPFTVEPAVSPSVYFESRYDQPGSAESTVYIFHGEDPAEEFTVCWGSRDGCLEDYTPVFTYRPAEEGTGEDWFGYRTVTYTAVPRGADRLLLYADGEYADTFALPPELLQTAEEPLASFAVISDTHVTNKVFHANNRRTAAAFRKLRHLEPDLIFVNGDLTDNGKQREYNNYRRLAKKARAPVYCSVGNHDVGLNQPVYDDFIDRYLDASDMDRLWYSFTCKAGTFIVLGTEDAVGLTANMASISDEQLSWLEGELASANPHKPIYVFLHQPLQYTMEGSGILHVDRDAELRALLDTYPNAILFSGHTHITMQSYALLNGEGAKASYVNTGAISSTWATADEELDGSEDILVEVYTDRILIRSRDFLGDQWFGGYEFMLMR